MEAGAQEVYAPIMSETEIYLICEQSMPTILNSDRTDAVSYTHLEARLAEAKQRLATEEGNKSKKGADQHTAARRQSRRPDSKAKYAKE